jgi:hypothetical protein
MTRLLDFAERDGVATMEFQVPRGKNSIALTLEFEPPPTQVGFRFSIDQSLDGAKWWLLGGGFLHDVRKLDAEGQPVKSFDWNLHEQLLRADECDRQGYAAMRDHEFGGRTYRQLQLCDRQRLTVVTTGPLTYSVDATVDDSPLPARLRAQLEGA